MAVEQEFHSCVQRFSPILPSLCLQQMVIRFGEVIQSKRRSSSIKNFEDLVSLLVKRDFIDPSNKSTWVMLDDVCKEIAGRPFVQPQLPHPTVAPSAPEGSTLPHGSSVLPEVVVNFLSTRISLSWRNFARLLKVPGAEIDRIESVCGTNYSECVKQVLLAHEKMPWTSKNSNVLEDIHEALILLQKDYLLNEFTNLTKRHRW